MHLSFYLIFISVIAVGAFVRTFWVERACDERIDKIVKEIYQLENQIAGNPRPQQEKT
ncbi:hypothetical protein Pla110_44020 [Polystyrenella longa]|uniref:Uncharacterized protein n=2 Tax=Polystyrenella longa TaxID=2528007 RepID=A0A518CTS9_9PLAN|nr:hypothetical protein Pla110_44020 [Polystyrenella longa]